MKLFIFFHFILIIKINANRVEFAYITEITYIKWNLIQIRHCFPAFKLHSCLN